MSAQTIHISHLSRDYGNGKGVNDLSFDIAQGECFGFLGPNGSGKTTVIRHLMGFLQPQSGSCQILGIDCWTGSASIQSRTGYIPGEISLFNDMSGKNFLDFIQSYRGSTEVRRRNELIDRFELDPTGLIKRMSKGMKQKVAIVAAFMHKPDILILDEPTSGLDPLMRSRFIALIEEEQHDGTTILMSSHIFEEVERTCNRVGIINKGNLVATDSIDVLKEQQVRRYTVTFADGASTQEFLREPFSSTLVQEQQLEVTVSGNLRAFLTSLSRYPVINLVTPTQNLEDIFMHYYADGEQS